MEEIYTETNDELKKYKKKFSLSLSRVENPGVVPFNRHSDKSFALFHSLSYSSLKLSRSFLGSLLL